MTWRKADSCLILSAISLGVCGPEAAGQALAGDNYEIDQGSSLVADGESIPGLFSNDELPPGFSVRQAEVVTEPEHGELVLNADGTFRYEPHPNFTGTDGFTYTAPISETVAVLSSRAPWRVLSPLDGRPPSLDTPNFESTWNTLDFEVSRSWLRGRGLMGYGMFGDSNNGAIAGTTPDTDLGLPAQGRRYSAYLRTVFQVPESGTYRLNATIRRDDGVIVYLDGQELFRSFQPGARTARTAPDGYFLMVEGVNTAWAFGVQETTPNLVEIPSVTLSEGEHCLAVSLHNAGQQQQLGAASSSDLGFQIDTLRLTKIGRAEVSIQVSPAQTEVTGEPDWFGVRVDEVLDTRLTDHNLYSNDHLLAPDGSPFRQILDLQIDDSETEGRVVEPDPQTGNFQFEPAAGFAGVTSFTYRIVTEGGQSDPIKAFIWVSSSEAVNQGPLQTVLAGSARTDLLLPIPKSASAIAVTTQPETARVSIVLLNTPPGAYARYSVLPTSTDLPRTGPDRLVIEFSPLPPDPTRVRVPLEFIVVSPMQAWRQSTFSLSQLGNTSISGALSDPDGDQYSNLEEYIFGTDPLDETNRPDIPLGVDAGDESVIYTAVQLDRLPFDSMCELQLRREGDVEWITIGANYGHPDVTLQNGWYTNTGLGNRATLPRDRASALLRYRFSLYPWAADIPEGGGGEGADIPANQ